MPLFMSDDEFARCSHDAMAVAESADAFIRRLYTELDTLKAKDLDKIDGNVSDKDVIKRLKLAVKKQRDKLEHEKTFSRSSQATSGYLAKENDVLRNEVRALSKQLQETKQGADHTVCVAKIQALVEIHEKTREVLKAERAKRKTITKSYDNVAEQRLKLLDELEKHKQAVKAATDEIEKLKNDQGNQLQGASAVELPPGTRLEDLAHSYLEAVEKFDLAAQPTRDEHGGLREAYSSAIYNFQVNSRTGPSCSPSDAINSGLGRRRRVLAVTMEEKENQTGILNLVSRLR
ncbi:hypothetical protein LIER_20335 [Lithospermum erythrorhizon]|uniref:Uncharacterized protein n=1 Tax=Lithospermum erythrorhizon TaxID=34254 RepID=A0AAV3QPK9_LITER